jgi:hypothetical protein
MKTSFSQTGFLLSSLLVSFVQANDPADSWLVYSKAAGKGSKVLSVNATWVVPDYPSVRGGGNAPGWWFGIEPNPADVLIQPILAYGDGSPEFTIFTGFYDWHNGNWIQSDVAQVVPGDVLEGKIWWNGKTYMQSIAKKGGKPITTTVSVNNLHAETFTDVYFVVEHQPNTCGEYPKNGNVTFTDIAIAWASGAAPSWTTSQFKPSCNSLGKIVSDTELLFTWNTA